MSAGEDLRGALSSLPAGIREALRRALQEGDAVRVAELPRARTSALLHATLATAAVVAWGVLLARRFGSPEAPFVSWSMLPLHIALATAGGGFAALAFGAPRPPRATPGEVLPSGVLLFPRGVLLVEGDTVTVVPGDAAGPRVEVGIATSGPAVVTVRRPDGSVAASARALPNVRSDAVLVSLAQRRHGAGARAFDHVVVHARAHAWCRPASEAPPARRAIPAALAGGALAVLALAGRNVLSDDVALSRAKAAASEAGDAALLDAYVRAGGRHAEEVKTDLLPGAELARIVRGGTTEELDRFAAEHPGRLADRARSERPSVLHRDFLARTEMSALRDFVRRYPEAADIPAARVRMHALYMETRRALRAHVLPGSDPDAVVVLEALLAWLEAHDDAPPIQVRFRRTVAPSLARADALLAKGLLDDDGKAPGGNAPVSPHMDARHAERRERAVVTAIQHALERDLPPDVLHLALGPPLPDLPRGSPAFEHVLAPTRPSLPDPPSVPVILVDYQVSWSGQTYVGKSSGRRYVGVAFAFAVTVSAPGTPQTVDLATLVEPESTFAVDYNAWDASLRAVLPDADGGVPRAGADDERVYEVMALRAFDQLASRLRERAFGAETPAK